MFILGLIVGIIVCTFGFLLYWGLCYAAARQEEQGELERLELEQRSIHKIINKE